MKFTFGKKPVTEVQDDKDDGGLLPDSEDITKGFSEEECRKMLNEMGRCVAHAYVATALIAAELDVGDEMTPIIDLIYKSHMKHINRRLEPILTDSKLCRLVPLTRI